MKRTNRAGIARRVAVIRERFGASHNGRAQRLFSVAISLVSLLTVLAGQAFAGSDKCAGGGFTILGLSGKQKKTIPAGSVGSSFLVKGKYVEFTVDAATFGIRN